MSYTPKKILLPSGLDELGLKRSMIRLPEEDLLSFKRRLLLEHRDPITNAEAQFRVSPGRQVGRPEQVLARLTPISATRLQVTSTRLRVWTDELVVDVSLLDRDTYFVYQLYELLEDYFEIEAFESPDKLSRKLTICDTNASRQVFLAENYVNRVGSYIEDPTFSDTLVFKTSKNSVEELSESGDYYVDPEGVIFSNDLQHGVCQFTTRVLPHYLTWSSVRVTPFNDVDIDYLIKDSLLEDTGLEPSMLNYKGTGYINRLLAVSGLEYSE